MADDESKRELEAASDLVEKQKSRKAAVKTTDASLVLDSGSQRRKIPEDENDTIEAVSTGACKNSV